MKYTLRQFQMVELAMLKQIDSRLRAEGIPYYLIGGSCIGALRHQGPIPWDDDADIGIPRRYFAKAEAVLQTLQEPYLYDPVERHRIQDAPLGHIYIKDGSPLTEGPRVDVFALDQVPDSGWKRRIQKFYSKVYHVCILRRPARNRGILKRVFTEILYRILPSKILDWLQKRSYRSITKWKDQDTRYISNLFGVRGDRETVPSEYFGVPRYVPYEDTQLPIPEHAEDYMTHIYGNYMEYPPEAERVPEHFDVR